MDFHLKFTKSLKRDLKRDLKVEQNLELQPIKTKVWSPSGLYGAMPAGVVVGRGVDAEAHGVRCGGWADGALKQTVAAAVDQLSEGAR